MKVKASDGGVSTIVKDELQDLVIQEPEPSVHPVDDIFFELNKKRKTLQ